MASTKSALPAPSLPPAKARKEAAPEGPAKGPKVPVPKPDKK